MNFSSSAHEHRSTAELFGASGYIWDWGRLTLENWQSDILGNIAVVVGSTYLLYKGSGMSRGSDDEIEQALQRIQEAVESEQGGTKLQPATEQLSRSSAGTSDGRRS
jgi:hypothetical protein